MKLVSDVHPTNRKGPDSSISGGPKIPLGVKNEELLQTDFITKRTRISNRTLELSVVVREAETGCTQVRRRAETASSTEKNLKLLFLGGIFSNFDFQNLEF